MLARVITPMRLTAWARVMALTTITVRTQTQAKVVAPKRVLAANEGTGTNEGNGTNKGNGTDVVKIVTLSMAMGLTVMKVIGIGQMKVAMAEAMN